MAHHDPLPSEYISTHDDLLPMPAEHDRLPTESVIETLAERERLMHALHRRRKAKLVRLHKLLGENKRLLIAAVERLHAVACRHAAGKA